MTPGENYYISGYKGPNEISKDVPDRAHILIFVVKVSDPDVATVRRGSLYNFAIMNSPKTGHLGKTIISPNW